MMNENPETRRNKKGPPLALRADKGAAKCRTETVLVQRCTAEEDELPIDP